MKAIFTILLFISGCCPLFAQDSLKISQTRPFVLGQTVEIASSILSENRTLNIYLPEGYNPADTLTYPVIYLLDGSADEDFIHVAGLVQFLNFPWVNTLPKSIVVGIANVDRKRDFTFPTSIEADKKDFPTTGGSEKFIAFIEKELQPFIERNYRTDTVKTLLGQSLGGLLATEVLLKKPFLFSRYIIVSPSLWWDNESLLAVNPALAKSPLQVYIAVGKEGKVMEKDAKRLAACLKKNKASEILVKFEFFPAKDHGNIYHQAVYNAFEAFNKLNKRR